MKYYPKSQLRFLQSTSNDNLVIEGTQDKYIGPYISTFDGKFFSGTIAGKNNIPLKKLITSTENTNKMGEGVNVIKHTILNKENYNFLSKTKPIPLSKPTPTDNDYKNGFFFRYFVKKINQKFGFKEINLKTYNKIIKRSEYDFILYRPLKIEWNLEEDALSKNKQMIKKIGKDYGISNLSIIFPSLNEYQRPILKVKQNLNTEGEELYNKDGSEYIGKYHIHPSKGPMIGPIHTDLPHDRLYYLDQIPQQIDTQSDVEEDFEEYLEKQRIKKIKDIKFNPIRPSVSQDIKTTRTTTPSRGSTSTPSRGGGGY